MTQEQTSTAVGQSVYTVRPSRLLEQIVQQIEESILGGALKPGDQLPAERALAQQFGVSRTAVRHAVKCLREKAVLESFSGKGTFVNHSHHADAYLGADLDFHLAMAETAGDPLVLSLLDSIVGLLREQRLWIFSVDGGPERGPFHRKRILEAIEQRSPEAACELMPPRPHLWQVHKDSTAAQCAEETVRYKTPL